MSTGSAPPVVKSVLVPLAPPAAFDLFTRELARWWPLATHSCSGGDAVDVVVEPRIGGRVVERARNGACSLWGTVLAWEPPHRFAMSWHPASDPVQATRVEVSFTATADGGCRLELVHSGWQARGDEAGEWRERYDSGWVAVLARYARAAAEPEATEA